MSNKHNRQNQPKRWRVPMVTFGRGLFNGNPRRCLQCGASIKSGETWKKTLSLDGVYELIEHAPKCPDRKTFIRFQKRLQDHGLNKSH